MGATSHKEEQINKTHHQNHASPYPMSFDTFFLIYHITYIGWWGC